MKPPDLNGLSPRTRPSLHLNVINVYSDFTIQCVWEDMGLSHELNYWYHCSFCGARKSLIRTTSTTHTFVLAYVWPTSTAYSKATYGMVGMSKLAAAGTAYLSVVRPVLEYACPVWHTNLQQYLSDNIESIQKRALKCIFRGSSYNEILCNVGLQTLKDRRDCIC